MAETNSSFLASQKTEQIYKLVAHLLAKSPCTPIITLSWIVTIMGPISGLLYLASAFQRIRTEGAWLVKIDKDGYLQPHTHVFVPLWAIFYTIVNLAHGITLLIDLRLGHSLQTSTLTLHMTTLPLIYAFGWTKVWTLIYALPPSKFALDQRRRRANNAKLGSRRCMPVVVYNAAIIIGYLFPFIFAIVCIVKVSRSAKNLNLAWNHLRDIYFRTGDPSFTPELEAGLYVEASSILALIVDAGIGAQNAVRTLTQGYLAFAICLLIGILATSIRIFSVLWFQLKLLRGCIQRRKSEQVDLFRIISANYVEPKFQISEDCSSPTKKEPISCDVRRSISISSTPEFPDWLPVLRRGAAIKAHVWESTLFNPAEKELAMSEKSILVSHYRELRRYAVNILWQCVLASLVITSYVGLTLVTCTNAFNVPWKMSFTEFGATLFLWGNITWNLGIGIILGVISCVVSFSPEPQVPQESAERIEDTTEIVTL